MYRVQHQGGAQHLLVWLSSGSWKAKLQYILSLDAVGAVGTVDTTWSVSADHTLITFVTILHSVITLNIIQSNAGAILISTFGDRYNLGASLTHLGQKTRMSRLAFPKAMVDIVNKSH